MATIRNQLSYGSQGSDVTELQKLLNNHGYNLDEDGIFGDNTKNAVTDFQKKKGLTVDGIVGTNTWGTLNGTYTPNTNTGTTSNTTATTSGTGFNYGDYQESDTVKQAQALLQQQTANKPGAYNSQWQGQLDDVIGQILNRDKFSYDLNADALYQQYANQYVNQGRMAMMDTMGQAAAMTGGYGNSYAQSVGQQAYQGYLQQLNDKIPDLYQLALQKYQMEGDALYDQYAMLGAQEEQDYGRHRDEVSDWGAEMERLQNQYNAERDYDYSKWTDGRDFAYGQYSDDRAYDYQAGRDQMADQQWQAEFNEAIRQFNASHGLGEYAPAPVVSSGGSGGSGGSSGGSSSTKKTTNTTNDDPMTGPSNAKNNGSDSGINTYSEAVAYMKANGVEGSYASNILTKSEFNRVQASGGTRQDANQYSSYTDYLKDAVAYQISQKGK